MEFDKCREVDCEVPLTQFELSRINGDIPSKYMLCVKHRRMRGDVTVTCVDCGCRLYNFRKYRCDDCQKNWDTERWASTYYNKTRKLKYTACVVCGNPIDREHFIKYCSKECRGKGLLDQSRLKRIIAKSKSNISVI